MKHINQTINQQNKKAFSKEKKKNQTENNLEFNLCTKEIFVETRFLTVGKP